MVDSRFRFALSLASGTVRYFFLFFAFIDSVTDAHFVAGSLAYLLGVLFSPLEFPVTAQNFNFACAIFGFVTILGIVSYFLIPEERWLAARQIGAILEATNLPVMPKNKRKQSDNDSMGREANGSGEEVVTK